jgi:hypothetical protein
MPAAKPGDICFSGACLAGGHPVNFLAMPMFHTEIVVEKDGKLHLDHVPFSEGESVHVYVSSATPLTKHPLKGSVLKYERPLAPVAEEDWESAK